MLEPIRNLEFIDTERRLIPDDHRRKVICKPTDFSTFKTPALLTSVELPIQVVLKSRRFPGLLTRIYLDGYDAQLEIPSRGTQHAQRPGPLATDLIGSSAMLRPVNRNENSILKNQAAVQITIARRINEKIVLIRMKDQSLLAEIYAERLALLLDSDPVSAGSGN